MDTEFDWDEFLHRAAVAGGVVMAIISIYFSYDGLDSTISGGNPAYTEIANYIGIATAIIVTLVEFIFNTDIKQLSITLIIGGILSYIYSISTNYLGLQHLFGYHGMIGFMIALFWDALPEAMIAWGLRNTESGDMIRNLFRFASGTGRRSSRGNNRPPQNQNRNESHPTPMHPFHPAPKKGQGRAFLESQRNNEHPNRFNVRDE